MADALDAQVSAVEPDINQIHLIASVTKAAHERRKRTARQGRLKREVGTLGGELLQPRQHDSPGLKRDTVWVKTRQPTSDDVGIDERAGSQQFLDDPWGRR